MVEQGKVKGEDWKAQKDKARYRKLRGGLNLREILREALGDWDPRNPEARVWAAAAWRRLDRALWYRVSRAWRKRESFVLSRNQAR